MQRNHPFHEFDILHQPDQVVGKELNRGYRAHASGVQCRGMHVPPFHEAEHLPCQTAHLQSLPVELAREWIKARIMSAILRYRCCSACGASVRSARSSTPGLVSRTICSQKSTPTRLSW